MATTETAISETAHNVGTSSSSSSSSTTTSSSSSSLHCLSFVWLSLCAVLVFKHAHLLAVFLSFVASFALAACLGSKTWLWISSRSALSAQDRMANTRTKALVGLVACTVSFYSLSSSSEASWGSSLFLASSLSAEYFVLSLSCGYLAFDHWFSALYCQPPPKPLGATIEDAFTLSFMLVLLTTLSAEDLASYRTYICTWIAYKTMRVALQLDNSSQQQQQQQQHASRPSQLHAEENNARTSSSLSLSLSIPSSPKKPSSSTTTTPQQNTQEAAETTTTTTTTTRKVDSSNETTRPFVDEELLWTIHGQTYDMAEYVDRHPGGKEAILLGRGRDCTALFESYHAFTKDQARTVLSKYRVVVHDDNAEENENPSDTAADIATDSPIPRDAFYDLLCQRVAETLRKKGIDPILDRTCTYQRLAYYAFIVVLVVVTAIGHFKGSILASFSLAICGWLLGALGHDAGHYSASRTPWINNACVWAMSFLCNPIMWQHQHTFAHHSHTNQFHADPDLHHFTSLLRVHQQFPQASIYKNQTKCLYVAFCYAFVVFGTCFWIPWGMMQQGSLYGMWDWTDGPRQRPWRAASMMLHFIAYFGFIMVWPFFTPLPWYKALSAVIAHVSTSGLMFAMFSQINHLNEASLDLSSSPAKRKDGTTKREDHDSMNLESSWAVAQVETSNNFAMDSALWHVLSNGLNLQIEHHLFPGLNHCHLHHIAPTVQAVCEEYGVKYKSYETWSDVMGATLDWLHRLATSDLYDGYDGEQQKQ